MKELKNNPEETKEPLLYEQAMRMKPRFASSAEAVAFYTSELDLLAKKRGVTVSKLLTEAENSSVFDEEYHQARQLWSSLSTTRALDEKYKK